MSLEVNIPDVVAEVRDCLDRYNAAINAGDADTLNGFFWSSPHTVRLGQSEHLFGYDEIAAFRSGTWKPGPERLLERAVITTFGRDFATASALFRRAGAPDGPINRQSQAWARFPEGWRIVAAHVSTLPMKA
jgi:ketosteroid isomerase-like protein